MPRTVDLATNNKSLRLEIKVWRISENLALDRSKGRNQTKALWENPHNNEQEHMVLKQNPDGNKTPDLDDDPTILFVDDEQKHITLYKDYTEQEYDSVETAMSGEEALRKINEETDIVFLDRSLPTMSGVEVLEEIHDGDYSPRIVMLTAQDPNDEIIELEIDDYETKPIYQTDLLEIIEKVLVMEKIEETLTSFHRLGAKHSALIKSEEADSQKIQDLSEEIKQKRQTLYEVLNQIEEVPDKWTQLVSTPITSNYGPI